VLVAAGVGLGVREALRPPDPLAELQKELASGRPVALIGETGPPRWHRWALGTPSLGRSSTGDGTCSFEAIGRSLLELCPDPMTDRYRLAASIRFAQTKITEDPGREKAKADPATDGRIEGVVTAGVYFGYSDPGGPSAARAHALFLVAFNDNPLPPAGNRPRTSEVHFRRWVILQDPSDRPGSRKGTIEHVPFTPAAELPGPWRRIEVEVTPERVRAWWDPTGTSPPFVDLPGEAVAAEYSKLNQKLAEINPAHGITLPPWSPRMPLGISAERAAVDVRDVTLTPLR
jgi:hypothetical protein